MKPGKYTGRVVDYGIGETKAGLPQVLVLFRFDADGVAEELTWYGSLKEGRAREITIDALLNCGLKTDSIEDLAGGKGSECLDLSTDVQLTVEEEADQDGKMHLKIRWVNAPGGAGFRKKMEKADAVRVMAGMNLKADIMARRQLTGKKLEEAPF